MEGRDCIVGFKEGEEYLVYAFLNKDVLWEGYCSRTRKLANATEDLKEFEEKGEKPQEIVEESKP
jgi:hypothetical protein